MPRATASLFFTWKSGLPLWLACLSAGICGSYFFAIESLGYNHRNSTSVSSSPTYGPYTTYTPSPTYSGSSGPAPEPEPTWKQVEKLVQRSLEIEKQVSACDERILRNKTAAEDEHRKITSLLTEGKKNATLSFKAGLEKEERAAYRALHNCKEAHTEATATKNEITKRREKVNSLRSSNQLYQTKNEVQSMESMLSTMSSLEARSDRERAQLLNIRKEIQAAVDANRRNTTEQIHSAVDETRQNSTPQVSTEPAKQNIITTVSDTALQDLTYKVLHLLVGASPDGRSLDSLFATTVTDLTNGARTSGSSIIRGINQLSNDYPARSVKFKHAGVQNEVLEIITARAFTDSSGNQVKRYGKTRITLNSRNLILSISDELYPAGTSEYEIDLSPGYMRIPYHRKTIISNSGK